VSKETYFVVKRDLLVHSSSLLHVRCYSGAGVYVYCMCVCVCVCVCARARVLYYIYIYIYIFSRLSRLSRLIG